jgi:hypothetical protein
MREELPPWENAWSVIASRAAHLNRGLPNQRECMGVWS